MFFDRIFFSSGKTTFLTNLLLQWPTLYPMQPLRKVCLIYSYDQPDYNRLREAYGDILYTAKTLSDKVLSKETLGNADANRPAMLIIDDSAWNLTNSSELTNLFCGACHHLKYVEMLTVMKYVRTLSFYFSSLCCIFVTQNFYASSTPAWRSAMRNARYALYFAMLFHHNHLVLTSSFSAVVFFRAPRDLSQLYNFGRQLYPRRSPSFVQAYEQSLNDREQFEHNPYG